MKSEHQEWPYNPPDPMVMQALVNQIYDKKFNETYNREMRKSMTEEFGPVRGRNGKVNKDKKVYSDDPALKKYNELLHYNADKAWWLDPNTWQYYDFDEWQSFKHEATKVVLETIATAPIGMVGAGAASMATRFVVSGILKSVANKAVAEAAIIALEQGGSRAIFSGRVIAEVLEHIPAGSRGLILRMFPQATIRAAMAGGYLAGFGAELGTTMALGEVAGSLVSGEDGELMKALQTRDYQKIMQALGENGLKMVIFRNFGGLMSKIAHGAENMTRSQALLQMLLTENASAIFSTGVEVASMKLKGGMTDGQIFDAAAKSYFQNLFQSVGMHHDTISTIKEATKGAGNRNFEKALKDNAVDLAKMEAAISKKEHLHTDAPNLETANTDTEKKVESATATPNAAVSGEPDKEAKKGTANGPAEAGLPTLRPGAKVTNPATEPTETGLPTLRPGAKATNPATEPAEAGLPTVRPGAKHDPAYEPTEHARSVAYEPTEAATGPVSSVEGPATKPAIPNRERVKTEAPELPTVPPPRLQRPLEKLAARTADKESIAPHTEKSGFDPDAPSERFGPPEPYDKTRSEPVVDKMVYPNKVEVLENLPREVLLQIEKNHAPEALTPEQRKARASIKNLTNSELAKLIFDYPNYRAHALGENRSKLIAEHQKLATEKLNQEQLANRQKILQKIKEDFPESTLESASQINYETLLAIDALRTQFTAENGTLSAEQQAILNSALQGSYHPLEISILDGVRGKAIFVHEKVTEGITPIGAGQVGNVYQGYMVIVDKNGNSQIKHVALKVDKASEVNKFAFQVQHFSNKIIAGFKNLVGLEKPLAVGQMKDAFGSNNNDRVVVSELVENKHSSVDLSKAIYQRIVRPNEFGRYMLDTLKGLQSIAQSGHFLTDFDLKQIRIGKSGDREGAFIGDFDLVSEANMKNVRIIKTFEYDSTGKLIKNADGTASVITRMVSLPDGLMPTDKHVTEILKPKSDHVFSLEELSNLYNFGLQDYPITPSVLAMNQHQIQAIIDFRLDPANAGKIVPPELMEGPARGALARAIERYIEVYNAQHPNPTTDEMNLLLRYFSVVGGLITDFRPGSVEGKASETKPLSLAEAAKKLQEATEIFERREKPSPFAAIHDLYKSKGATSADIPPELVGDHQLQAWFKDGQIYFNVDVMNQHLKFSNNRDSANNKVFPDGVSVVIEKGDLRLVLTEEIRRRLNQEAEEVGLKKVFAENSQKTLSIEEYEGGLQRIRDAANKQAVEKGADSVPEVVLAATFAGNFTKFLGQMKNHEATHRVLATILDESGFSTLIERLTRAHANPTLRGALADLRELHLDAHQISEVISYISEVDPPGPGGSIEVHIPDPTVNVTVKLSHQQYLALQHTIQRLVPGFTFEGVRQLDTYILSGNFRTMDKTVFARLHDAAEEAAKSQRRAQRREEETKNEPISGTEKTERGGPNVASEQDNTEFGYPSEPPTKVSTSGAEPAQSPVDVKVVTGDEKTEFFPAQKPKESNIFGNEETAIGPETARSIGLEGTELYKVTNPPESVTPLSTRDIEYLAPKSEVPSSNPPESAPVSSEPITWRYVKDLTAHQQEVANQFEIIRNSNIAVVLNPGENIREAGYRSIKEAFANDSRLNQMVETIALAVYHGKLENFGQAYALMSVLQNNPNLDTRSLNIAIQHTGNLSGEMLVDIVRKAIPPHGLDVLEAPFSKNLDSRLLTDLIYSDFADKNSYAFTLIKKVLRDNPHVDNEMVMYLFNHASPAAGRLLTVENAKALNGEQLKQILNPDNVDNPGVSYAKEALAAGFEVSNETISGLLNLNQFDVDFIGQHHHFLFDNADNLQLVGFMHEGKIHAEDFRKLVQNVLPSNSELAGAMRNVMREIPNFSSELVYNLLRKASPELIDILNYPRKLEFTNDQLVQLTNHPDAETLNLLEQAIYNFPVLSKHVMEGLVFKNSKEVTFIDGKQIRLFEFNGNSAAGGIGEVCWCAYQYEGSNELHFGVRKQSKFGNSEHVFLERQNVQKLLGYDVGDNHVTYRGILPGEGGKGPIIVMDYLGFGAEQKFTSVEDLQANPTTSANELIGLVLDGLENANIVAAKADMINLDWKPGQIGLRNDEHGQTKTIMTDPGSGLSLEQLGALSFMPGTGYQPDTNGKFIYTDPTTGEKYQRQKMHYYGDMPVLNLPSGASLPIGVTPGFNPVVVLNKIQIAKSLHPEMASQIWKEHADRIHSYQLGVALEQIIFGTTPLEVTYQDQRIDPQNGTLGPVIMRKTGGIEHGDCGYPAHNLPKDTQDKIWSIITKLRSTDFDPTKPIAENPNIISSKEAIKQIREILAQNSGSPNSIPLSI